MIVAASRFLRSRQRLKAHRCCDYTVHSQGRPQWSRYGEVIAAETRRYGLYILRTTVRQWWWFTHIAKRAPDFRSCPPSAWQFSGRPWGAGVPAHIGG